MEEIIKEKLLERYSKVKINVYYEDIRIYKIKATLSINFEECKIEFLYKYDNYLTEESNINLIENELNKRIIKYCMEE